MTKKTSNRNTLAHREHDKITYFHEAYTQRMALALTPLPKLEHQAEKLLSLAGHMAALSSQLNAVAHELSSQFKTLRYRI